MPNEDFEREKACYEQNFEHMRGLNEQMNRVPALAITVTGGLWFGATLLKEHDELIKFLLLSFAGICNIALILVSFRIRDVIESYLEQLRKFSPTNFASGQPSQPMLKLSRYAMISIYCFLMGSAGLLSFFVAFLFYWPLDSGGLIAFFVLLWCLYAAGIPLFGRRASQ